jgi:hypothetical protein
MYGSPARINVLEDRSRSRRSFWRSGEKQANETPSRRHRQNGDNSCHENAKMLAAFDRQRL